MPHPARLILVFLILLPTLARANGVYFPERASPALPTIPTQRAIILHRDNTETLIVESTFSSTSKNVAWILPLPAPPTSLDLAEPGILTSTTTALSPTITHDLPFLPSFPFALCVGIVPLALIVIFIKNVPHRRSIFRSILVLELFFLVIAILLPTLGTAGNPIPQSAAAFTLLSSHHLGDADAAVLTATSPDDLDTYLASLSLRPLDAPAKTIVADYISHGWCFVVSHLTNPDANLATPRPLIATFPAAHPLFPMKITALANSATHVELTIVADDQAAAQHFHAVAADTFTHVPARSDGDHYSTGDYYAAPATQLFLGHPDLLPLLWQNCTITQLTADLTPQQMSHDVLLSFFLLSPHRDRFFTDRSQKQIAAAAFFAAIALSLILAAAFGHGRRRPTFQQSKYLLLSLLLIPLAPLAVRLFLPTTPVIIQDRRARRSQIHQSFNLAKIASSLLPPTPSAEDIAALPQRLVAASNLNSDDRINHFTNQPLRPEASPGNFTLRTLHNHLYLCTYNQSGIESRLPLPQ